MTHHASRRGGRAALCRGARTLLAFLALAAVTFGAPAPSAEYRVKAVFLFNFAQFVDWPPEALARRQTPLVIGILGDDPFGTYLDELVQGEKISGHPMLVRRYRRVADVDGCQILFIGSSEAGRLEQILPALRGRQILTVGDAENFSRQGGMVRFVTEDGKIRLRINVEAARESGLVISSKILRPATIVTATKG